MTNQEMSHLTIVRHQGGLSALKNPTPFMHVKTDLTVNWNIDSAKIIGF